jgi:hypothetical protein
VGDPVTEYVLVVLFFGRGDFMLNERRMKMSLLRIRKGS